MKRWLWEASRKTDPMKHWWHLLVRLIQRTFKDGVVMEEVAWATMVFLPKCKGEYWGI